MRIDAVRSDFDEFTEEGLSVLKFKKLLKQTAPSSSALSAELSRKDEMRFEKDTVKDSRSTMHFSKHFYTALCASPFFVI